MALSGIRRSGERIQVVISSTTQPFLSVYKAASLAVAQLGVPADVLAGHGAVSEPVAQAMALGALAASRASIALSVTGVAGPGGGTAAKPVGTVCFGWAVAGAGVESHTRHFSGDRSSVRMQSARYALEHALALLPAMAAASEQQPMRSDALAKKD